MAPSIQSGLIFCISADISHRVSRPMQLCGPIIVALRLLLNDVLKQGSISTDFIIKQINETGPRTQFHKSSKTENIA